MIKAEFKKVNGHFFSYSITGHADYAEKGKDIVCASVSALYIGITNQLVSKYRAKERVLGETREVFIMPFRATDYLAVTLYESLLSIAEEYPDNVQVSLEQIEPKPYEIYLEKGRKAYRDHEGRVHFDYLGGWVFDKETGKQDYLADELADYSVGDFYKPKE